MADVVDENSHYRVGCRSWRGLGSAAAHAIVAGILAISAVGAPSGYAQTLVPSRIAASIRSDQMQAIHGTLHPLVAQARDEGQLSGSTAVRGMSLVFRRSAAQESDLKSLLKEQQTKGSPTYHRWLGPGQFSARFGVSQSDLAKVAKWLQSQGFKIDAIPASADRIEFSGTAAQVNAAFQTQLHSYFLHGQSHWANATELSLPQAIAGMTLSIEHLNTFRPMPRSVKNQVHVTQRSTAGNFGPHYTLQGSRSEVNYVAPSDVATIYDVSGMYNKGITGKGKAIAIAGQTDITQYHSDIANFRSLSGLDATNIPTQILVPNTGGAQVYPGDLEEADIDVEWSGAVAKDATILYVTVGSNQNKNVFDALQYAIQNPLINNTQFVPVISISYGDCEQAFAGGGYIQQLESVFEQANAQGQTVVASSGDSGSADCDLGKNSQGQASAASQGLAVDYPASSQYVTAAGGSSFAGDLADQGKYWSQTNSASNGSALSYIPETTWNNTSNLAGLANAGSLSASGGGSSTLFSKPSWQVGSSMSNDGRRDVPDISLASDPNHDGYVLCTEETNSAGTALTGASSCAYPVGSNEVPYFDATENGYLYGGTSIAAPQIAAMITLWNQEAGNTSGAGNINPILYLTAQDTPAAFHDVTTGSNAVVCQQGSPNCVPDPNASNNYIMSCCAAGSGYDLATGLGSVDVAAMGAVWPVITAENAGFSLLSKSGTVSVSPGSSTSATLVLSASGAGSNSAPGFTGTVSLACSSLPAGVSCSFAPSSSISLTPGATQNVTLTVSATTAAHFLTPPLFNHSWPMQATLAGLFGVFMLGVGRKRRLPSRWMALLLLVVGLMATTGMTACGSGSPGGGTAQGGTAPGTTAPGAKTSTIIVTGTSGSSTASASIQVSLS